MDLLPVTKIELIIVHAWSQDVSSLKTHKTRVPQADSRGVSVPSHPVYWKGKRKGFENISEPFLL
jgi:hypothetical protein